MNAVTAPPIFTQSLSMRLTDEELAICDEVKAAIRTARPRTSYRKIADIVGETYDIVNNIANRRTSPDPEVVEKIRKAIEKPEGWPWSVVRKHGPGPIEIQSDPALEVEVVGNVAAGVEIYNVDPVRRVVTLPAELAAVSDLAFIIEGDSGMPHIEDEDCACFKSRHKPKHGYPFLIQTEDGGMMVKVTWFDRGEWYLRSYNKKYRPFRLPDGARICGIFVGWYRKKGQRKQMDSDPEGLTYEFELKWEDEFTQKHLA